MATMRDVAKLANVSVSTVSNFLNGTKPIKAETRHRIEQAAKELHFQPNSMAKSLRNNHSTEIGIILPSLSDPYFADIYRGLNNIFSQKEYFVTFASTNEIEAKEKRAALAFIQKRVAGIIVATCHPHKVSFYQENCLGNNIPIVFIDRKPVNIDANFVHINNYEPIYNIVSSLLSQGLRHIALLTGYTDFSSQKECVTAYQDAYTNTGIPYNPSYIRHGRISRTDAFDCSVKMLAHFPLEAIITSSETLMQGVRQAAYVRQIRANEDVLLISLGEESWCSNTFFKKIITTTRPANQLGETAASLLLSNIQAPFTFEPQSQILHDSFCFEQSVYPLQHEVLPHPSVSKELNILLVDSHGISTSIEALRANFEIETNCSINIHTASLNTMLDEIIDGSDCPEPAFDIVMYDHPWLYYLASEGYLMDITNCIERDFSLHGYFPNATDLYGKFNNRYYGIPFTFSPPLLLYRKDLFDNPILQKEYREKYQVKLRPPLTWTEYNTIAEFFTKEYNPNSPVDYGTSLYGQIKEYIVPQFLYRLAAFGGSLFDENMNVTIRSTACRKALQSLKSTMDYVSKDDLGISLMDAIEEFLNKKTAMLICHASYASEIVKKRSINTQEMIGYSLIPGKHSLLTGWGLGITNNCQKKDLALDFMKWVTRKDICEYRTILEGQSLSYNCHQNSELQESCPWLSLETEAYEYCIPRTGAFKPNGKVVPRDIIEQQINLAIYPYLLEDRPVETVMEDLERCLTSLFRVYGYTGSLQRRPYNI